MEASVAESSEEIERQDGYGNEAVVYLTEEKQQEVRELEQQINIKVGSFYEVDHSKLSPKSPEQLYSIRVVMVSEENSHGASLRFPSVHSLRTHFSQDSCGEPEGKKLPALDEKYVMSSDVAARVLLRRIPPQEMAERGGFWSFWSPPSLSPPEKLGSKTNSCLSRLRFSGLLQWGKRRQVRFLNRHEESKGKEIVLVESGLSVDTEKKEEEEEEEQEEEEEEVETFKKLRSSKRKIEATTSTIKAESSRRPKRQKETQLVVNPRSKKKSTLKNSIERWSTARYKLAEENMLKIMKEKGAFFGNPMLRPALRNEARKLIGDTGLLDHLLKHMAGKVAPGDIDRFRRRHNSDGAMEYWIENADLMSIRKQAGVQDPYWTPPPGWKPGDNPIQDPVSAQEIDSLKKEMAKMKKSIQEIVSAKEDQASFFMQELKRITAEMGNMKRNVEEVTNFKKPEDLSIVTDHPNFTTSSEGCDDGSSFLMMKGITQEQVGTQKSGGINMSDSEEATPPLLSLHHQSDKEIPESDKAAQEHATCPPEYPSVQNDQEEDRATRIQRLKSGFRICKPQGSFLWPTMAAFPFVVVPSPTPPSASSTSAPALGPHAPPSPLKPRAVRPRSSVASFNASSSVHPPKTPQNFNFFNLNESPVETSAEKDVGSRMEEADWVGKAAQKGPVDNPDRV